MNLPSSHGGGVLPGNHKGLSGSATAHTVAVLDLVDALLFLITLSFFPPRKEAFVASKLDTDFLELHKTTLEFSQTVYVHFNILKFTQVMCILASSMAL